MSGLLERMDVGFNVVDRGREPELKTGDVRTGEHELPRVWGISAMLVS